MEPLIRIEHMSKVFGTGDNAVRALEDISLDVFPGEIFGVIGLSGAGKSTLVRCMNLLEKPTGGSVTVAGMNMMDLPDRELRQARQSIGMIFQGFNLLMQSTALQNVCFPLELAGVKKKDAVAKARTLLQTVGLGDREAAYPAQLSGGQKQRVAIARALATDPKVLLCDEATSALDPTTTQSILALLKQLNESLGVTIVVITHEMKVIEQICSRVAIISDSHIVEEGPVAEVFRHPKTPAAKKLILPMGRQQEEFIGGGRCLRLVFDGKNTDKPIIADMVLTCGAAVSIIFADTKLVGGRDFGQMVLRLPDSDSVVQRMLAYLDEKGVSYEEEAMEDVFRSDDP